MAILINLNDALNELNELEGSAEYNKGVTDAFNALFDLLPVNAAPIKHGRWVEDEYGFLICSECGNTAEYLPFCGQIETPYCSECGAKMDEVQNDKEI